MADEIQAFYERHPYPPPVDDLERYRRLWQDDRRRRADHHLVWPARRFERAPAVLVAGCGTSQAAKHALRWPDARVTGIDVSAASVRATLALKRKHDLRNLEVRELPLEQVGELGATFDLIVCTGVLHHLADPDVGLAALRDVLAPTGAMQLMVYAPYGRTGVYMIQQLCRRIGVGPTARDIEDLVTALEALPPGHPLDHLLREAPDFQDDSALADALLNPRDRAYSVPEVFELVERAGLAFGRWCARRRTARAAASSPSCPSRTASRACRGASNTRPSSCSAARWSDTASPSTGPRRQRGRSGSPSRATPGRATCPSGSPTHWASAWCCLLSRRRV